MPNNKIKKSIWLPSVILIYFTAMTLIFGVELIKSGEILRFTATVVAEIAVIIALFYFLRKKEKNENK